jgi:hypothetical protein
MRGRKRHLRGKTAKAFLSIALAGILWIPSAVTAHAEELQPAGYHEFETTEDEAIDHWYGISRGTYLKDGTSGVVRAGTGKVSVSGTTTAHSVCDTVKVGVYLDESSNGGSSFSTIGTYHFSESNTSSCHGSKANISVTSGRLYRARGGHSVTKGSTTETTTTCTSALTAS